MRRLTFIALLLAGTVAAAAQFGGAQIRGRRAGEAGLPEELTDRGSSRNYDGRFRFCRIRFRNSPAGDGGGWFVDYPRADENLSLRLAQVTKTPVMQEGEGLPSHLVISLTDPDLFQCPFVMMTEPGGADINDREAAQLRDYLLKGGFLWADDFWGSYAWEWWARQIGKALPPSEYQIIELPLSHPIYHVLFDVDQIPQIPNIGLWLTSHITSERGSDSAEAHARAILDHKGRVMVFMTYNTDFGDAYEQESVSPDYFRNFSVQAYAIGVNVLLYAMTH